MPPRSRVVPGVVQCCCQPCVVCGPVSCPLLLGLCRTGVLVAPQPGWVGVELDNFPQPLRGRVGGLACCQPQDEASCLHVRLVGLGVCSCGQRVPCRQPG